MLGTEAVIDAGERWRGASVWALAVFAATLPISHVPAQLSLGASVFCWARWSLHSGKLQFSALPMMWPLAFYLAWNVLAAAMSERPVHSLLALIDNEWPVLTCLMMLWCVRNVSELRRILFGLFVVSGGVFLYGIVQSITGMDFVKGIPLEHQIVGGLHRAVGFSGYPLTFAGFAMSVFFLSLGAVIGNNWNHRAMWGVPILAVGAIVATYSRSVWIAMALIAPLIGFRWGPRIGWRSIGVCATIAVVILLSSEPLRDRAWSSIDPEQNQTRLNLWKSSLRIVSDHPILGIGQDNFTLAFERYKVEGSYDTSVHPHNDYLSVLVHGGFPALLAFGAIWTLVLRSGWVTAMRKNSEQLEGIALGGVTALCGFLISALFQNYYGTFVNCFNWWMVAGVILTSHRLSAQTSESKV